MKLHQLITTPSYGWLTNRSETFYLPTEFQANTPEELNRQKFKMGRYYTTDLYHMEGQEQLLTPSECYQLKEWNGTWNTPGLSNVYLYEIWEDWGDDGHIDFRMTGWTLSNRVWKNPFSLYNLMGYNCWMFDLEELISEIEETTS